MTSFHLGGRSIALVGSLAIALSAGTALAHGDRHKGEQKEAPGHSHERASGHGGEVTMTKEFHFEVVFDDKRIAVYAYDAYQNPISAKDLGGTVEIRFRGERPALKSALAFRDDGKQGYLEAGLNLAGIKPGDAKATIKVDGLAGEGEKEVSFIQAVQLSSGRGREKAHEHGDRKEGSHRH